MILALHAESTFVDQSDPWRTGGRHRPQTTETADAGGSVNWGELVLRAFTHCPAYACTGTGGWSKHRRNHSKGENPPPEPRDIYPQPTSTPTVPADFAVLKRTL